MDAKRGSILMIKISSMLSNLNCFNLGEDGRQGWGRTTLYAINRRKKVRKVFKHGPTAVPNDRFLSDSDWRSKRSGIWSRLMYPYRRISFIFEAQLFAFFFFSQGAEGSCLCYLY